MRMLCLVLFLTLLLAVGASNAPVQAVTTAEAFPPPPEVTAYTIAATYDPQTYTLTARQTATYRNLTADPIPDLYFHLYLNAFSNPNTAWLAEAGPGHRGFSFDAAAPGLLYVNAIRLADGEPLQLTAVDRDNTLAYATLPVPVAPGEAVTVEIEFIARLPRVFARTGWADDGDFVLAGQWFPKFGVWEHGAWNVHPFTANSEFYADFGTYDVALTLPAEWVIGATGGPAQTTQADDAGNVTHSFHAEHVIDFAWGASPHFKELTRTAEGVAVRVLHYPQQRADARRALQATTGGLEVYTAWYGPYGMGLYPHLTVILVPPDAGGAGGMEYPTLFTVGAMQVPLANIKLLEVETVHELGHQWFQSVVATNEAEAPWLDEGFTDYITRRAMDALYGGAVAELGAWTFSYLDMHRLTYRFMSGVPMAGAAWEFGAMEEYATATYTKPVLALTTLERTVGEEAMLAFMRAYYTQYAFAHPTAADVRAVMEATLDAETAEWFFEDLVYGDATLDARVLSFSQSPPTVNVAMAQVMLERTGGVCIPTTVRVESGARRTETLPWPCTVPIWTHHAPVIRSVVIDPDLAIPIDVNLANNGVQTYSDVAGWLGLTARTVRVLQELFWGGLLW